ncbi:MAG: DUF1326 domain-containing protein [Gemmataceae bacterium]|nr:DUF1326 domain-containing protein [Gemmataceae bacterium]MCI0739671.1 DUF1326 domain-containing protein [Gemmataceae bacterium]
MKRFALALLVLIAVFNPAFAAGITGQYVEARTCDVWTGPCFANADFNLSGKHAVLAWRVEKGDLEGVALEGLNIVAVVSAQNTLGLEQTGPAKAVLIIDQRANASQKEALIRLAKKQAGRLLDNVVGVQSAKVNLTLCQCDGETCAELDATVAKLKTRCIDHKEDKACGNESAYYPPLARGVHARVGGVVEHLFRGNGLNETWSDYGRRGAYVGSFEAK